MKTGFEDYEKSKNYLICVDSDGCAMDTMNSKHKKCFGPCMIEEWELNPWNREILTRWNEMNLYTMTRGINRFKGLLMMLREIDGKYTHIEGLEELAEWAENTRKLSNASLQRKIEKTDSLVLKKALRWSEMVNERVQRLEDKDKQPFEGVKEALAYARQFADIAIVSSANLKAVLEEWERHGLLELTDLVLAQESGSKASGISGLVKKGYDKAKILMTGDAPGDLEAAQENGVFYYPILVGKEKESWREFQEKAVQKLTEGDYQGTYQEEKIQSFLENLS